MKPKVMVVDDDPGIRRANVRGLRGLGWEALEAKDPEEVALAFRSGVTVDVILTDWDMPAGGGARIIEEATVPVVVYSGNPRIADLAQRYVEKPAGLADLDRALRTALYDALVDAQVTSEEAEESGDLEDRLDAQLKLGDLEAKVRR